MLEPRLVPVILVLFGLTVSLMMVRRYRHEVRLGEIGGPGQHHCILFSPCHEAVMRLRQCVPYEGPTPFQRQE